MLLAWVYLALPDPLFSAVYSTVVLDKNGSLLSARVADDEQWRFPMSDSLPVKYVVALLASEDRHFLRHNGVYLPSLVKAAIENVKSRSIKRGGSTITMQLVRISQGNPPRNIPRKIAEILLALRLELTYNKEDILKLYAAHAPFGSNVVGLEAASWRYFGKPPSNLTWAECATLAVLPNNPGMIYPGKKPDQLEEKRNKLLLKLSEQGIISDETCELSMMERIPDAPEALPDLAPHLLNRLVNEGKRGCRINTTINSNLQKQVEEIMARHHEALASNEIHNMAVLVVETLTGAVRIYQGNIKSAGKAHGADVDVIKAPRSSGSILKPFLYAMMLDDGLILPEMLVEDIPIHIGNFRPVNYSRQYSGAVPARKALARSLNIPAVMMLRDYGTARFCDRMRKMGMTTLTKPASHYGLSVILGGGESKLWELCGLYSSMGRTLMRYTENDGRYMKGDFHLPYVLIEDYNRESDRNNPLQKHPEHLNAASIWQTFKAMIEVSRPDEDANWFHFSSSSRVAWKTGTSYGNRDAWAVGVTPGWVVGVWVGNASGEGRPSLTGTSSAAPVMFDIFSRLPGTGWFDTPWDNLTQITVCRYSGHPATENCEPTDTIFSANVTLRVPPCPYHQIIHLDPSETYQVNSFCMFPSQMIHKSWFVLPPVTEYYFKPLNPFYKSLPPIHPDCITAADEKPRMEIIYPVDLGEIHIPTDISGRKEKVIFEVAHQVKNTRIFWYLNETFIGTTTGEHKISLNPDPGWHKLTITDESGHQITRRFKVK